MRTIANKITARQMFRLATCTFIGLSMAACAGDDATQGEQQGNNEDKNPVGTTIFSSVDQSDESAPSTRTAIVDHVKGGGAKVNWSATDKVWAKDDNGTWQQSGTAVLSSTGDLSKADFAFTGTYTGATHEVLYTNMPMSGTQPQVEIKAEQTQTAPNNFDHAGESGDFGIATATQKGGGVYKFTLNHKASYICLIPRSANPCINRSKLTKIEIDAKDNIAGTYNIEADGTLTLASGGTNSITLTTGTGFDLDNPADDMDKNAAYVVIAPGTHTLRIRYWLKNTTDGHDPWATPLTSIEGTITKIVTMNFEAGKIHDITANLNPDYDGNHYFNWDAKLQFWTGREWTHGVTGWQPTVSMQQGTPDWSNPDIGANFSFPGAGIRNDAVNSCKDCPNANEMMWYATKGDPIWDDTEIFSLMGRLYTGGVWLKKKARIASDNSTTAAAMANAAPNGTDYRTTYGSYSRYPLPAGIPSASDIGDYFYLPSIGQHMVTMFTRENYSGSYWSSSADPNAANTAYLMTIRHLQIGVGAAIRDYPQWVQTFE